MSLIDSIQNSFGTSSTTTTNTEISEQSLGSTGAENGGVFASFLSSLPNSSALTSANDGLSSISDMNDSIDSIQQSLLNGLGLGGLTEEGLALLTSDESISMMQGNLLSSLQTSLFSSLNTTTDLDTTETSSELLGNVAANDTLFSYLSNASQYTVGEDGLAVDDLFDTVNVLNHIPVVADLYQKYTETTVDPISDIVGGYAYGGPIGLGYSAINLAVESWTGKSIFNNVSDYFLNDQQQATLQSTSDKVSDTLEQANSSYHFVSRTF